MQMLKVILFVLLVIHPYLSPSYCAPLCAAQIKLIFLKEPILSFKRDQEYPEIHFI